jgi:hypothetical protein
MKYSLYVIKPQNSAKVSPAPVGSNTSSNGNAGAKNIHSLCENSSLQLFLITNIWDPFPESAAP